MPKQTTKSKKRRSVNKSKEWRPNAKQIKMVQLLNNPNDRRPEKDKCIEVGITPKTLWEWRKNPNFVAYRNAQMDKYTDGELPEVWKAHLLQCQRGNMEAIKTFYKMKGVDPELLLKLKELEFKQQIELEKLKLAQRKAGDDDDDQPVDDGFIDALNAEASSIWSDGDED
jgi:hypothetical protein